MGMYGMYMTTGVHRAGQHPYTSPHFCDMAGTRPPEVLYRRSRPASCCAVLQADLGVDRARSRIVHLHKRGAK